LAPSEAQLFPSPNNNTTTSTRNIIQSLVKSKVRISPSSSISYGSERARFAQDAGGRGREAKHRSHALPTLAHHTKHRNRPHQFIELTDTVQNKLFTSSLAAEPALARKVRGRGCSSQRRRLGAHIITLKQRQHHFPFLTALIHHHLHRIHPHLDCHKLVAAYR